MTTVGTIISAAIRTGARIVIMMKDFFLTLVRYSLFIITGILFMTCWLQLFQFGLITGLNHPDEYLGHGGECRIK